MTHRLLHGLIDSQKGASETTEEQLTSYAQQLMNSVFEIQDLRARLTFIRQKRHELQEVLLQSDSVLSDEEMQLLQADDLALGMLERAYLEHVLENVLEDEPELNQLANFNNEARNTTNFENGCVAVGNHGFKNKEYAAHHRKEA